MRADLAGSSCEAFTAKATGKPTRSCPICGKITTRANLCGSCAAGKSSRRNSKPRPARPAAWSNLADKAAQVKPAGNGGRAVRTVLHVEGAEIDDPARAVAVDAILARRRAVSRKGAFDK